jgi:hypothetical protein
MGGGGEYFSQNLTTQGGGPHTGGGGEYFTTSGMTHGGGPHIGPSAETEAKPIASSAKTAKKAPIANFPFIQQLLPKNPSDSPFYPSERQLMHLNISIYLFYQNLSTNVNLEELLMF